jgi:hypothetical protein
MGAMSGDRAGGANKRERSKQSRSRRAQAAGEVGWEGFDWQAVSALTMCLVASGGALRVGATRDGGAWAFGVYLGDDYATEYVKPSEVFSDAIGEIAQAWLPDRGVRYWELLTDARAQTR